MICITFLPGVWSKDGFKADKAKVKGNGMVNSCIIKVEEPSHLNKRNKCQNR